MKKNLKKLISTVAALAIAVSCVPAFAADFTDVPATADYKTAVDNIVALGIAEGNPDGTFAPENLIKRSEAAKMIVGTMGPAMMNAAAASKGVTGFSDVPAEHWASGFVVQGVSKGYINGMGDGTFAPDANVTFGQMAKMLVCVLGYEEDAEAAGGWIGGGYISHAASLGITEGFENYPADQAVNRAEVAELINNSLTIPVKAVVDHTTGFEIDEDGNLKTVIVPVLKVMNGKNGYDYETLLTTYFDAFAVRGRITSTDKKVKGQVTYRVEYAKNFEGYEINSALEKYSPASIQAAFPAEADVDELLGTYTNAIVIVNEDEEYELLSIESYGKNDIVELSSELYAAFTASVADHVYEGSEVDGTFGTIEFYKNADTSRTNDYKLDKDVQYFVNGKQTTSAAISKYVYNNATTEVKLVDTPEAGRNTIDGIYDFVMLSVYTSAVVDEVIADEDEVQIFIDKQNTAVAGVTPVIEIDLNDIEDGDAEYTLVDTEGKEVKFEELEKDDVITIYTDFLAAKPLANPESIDMVVCRDTAEGAVSETNSDKKEFAIASEWYGFAHDEDTQFTAINAKVGESYTLYLDKFGKVVKTETIASSKNYGIINRVWEDNAGEKRVRLVNADGEIVSYVAKDNTAYTEAKTLYDAADGWKFNDDSSDNDAYTKAVVTYKLNASDKIYDVATIAVTLVPGGTFSDAGLKIGSAKMSDITKVVDYRGVVKTSAADDWKASLSGKVSGASTDMFVDDETYTVLYGGTKIDGKTPFVIVLAGDPSINDDTAFAVVKSVGFSTNEADGISYKTAVVMQGKEEIKLYFESDSTVVNKGDVIVYSLNNEGLVESGDFYNMFSTATERTFAGMETTFPTATNIPSEWSTVDAGEDAVAVEFGVMLDKLDSSIVVGTDVAKATDDDVVADFIEANDLIIAPANYKEVDLAAEVNVYVYDQGARTEQLSIGSTASLRPTAIGRQYYQNDAVSDNIYNWTKAGKTKANTVIYKTVDDEITDIVLIMPAN